MGAMSDMLTVLVLVAAPASVLLTIRWLNVRDERRDILAGEPTNAR